jgi:DNA-binding transcriptional LysR family regulator
LLAARPMKLDPVSLKLFVAVMEDGAISRAAHREHLAVSAASKRLSELEHRLGTRLFERSNRGIEATAAAFTLLHLARGAIHQLEDIELQMREYASGVRGDVRLFANVSAITQFLPAELSAFAASHPGVRIHLHERISSLVASGVMENVADLGIMAAGTDPQTTEVWPYHRDELVLVVPRGHPLGTVAAATMADALQHEFVGMHPGSAINQLLLRAARDRGISLNLRVEVSSFDALCLMVCAGLGIGLIPRKSAQLFLPSLDLQLIALNEQWAIRQLFLCARWRDGLNPAAALLLDHLRACASPQRCCLTA